MVSDMLTPLEVYVKNNALNYGAHGSDHLFRVWKIAKKIGIKEGANLKILEPMALLHDIIRPEKENDNCHAKYSSQMAQSVLRNLNYTEDEIKLIVSGILSHSIHCDSRIEPDSLEAKVLFDADKIEAVGPIGISRWFLTMSKKDFSVEVIAKMYLGTINDFKLTHKMLYTKTGNKLIKDGLKFSTIFMKRLLQELKQYS